MTIASLDGTSKQHLTDRRWLDVPAWAWFGTCVFALVMIAGDRALLDADTYWQIAVGQSIISHHALPVVDSYSFTKFGEPWISSSWLSQVIFAEAYAVAGWAGPVSLTAFAVAATYTFFVRVLSERFAPIHAVIIGMTAALVSMGHFLARPHILALPVMLAWGYGLVSANDRRQMPSYWLLLLIVLWANLHGSFVFGVALVAPFALDALWDTERSERRALALRWVLFGAATLAASCVTPYGWDSILAARKILNLGEAMSIIPEWQPVNFGNPKLFEVVLLACFAGLLLRGLKLSPPRILLVTGLLYMALSHVRNIEVLALLMPLVVAKPLAEQWRLVSSPQPRLSLAGAVVLAVALCSVTFGATFHNTFEPARVWTPVTAVQVLKDQKAQRILHGPGFGSYLITQGIPTFIDGRAELYGEKFIMDAVHAIHLADVAAFLKLLDTYKIDATLLTPSEPAVSLLDHLDGWKRIYADDKAVVHVRVGGERNADLPVILH